MFHIDRDYKLLSRDYVYIYEHELVEIKEERQPALFSVRAKEIESLFLQVSLYEYLSSVLDEKHVLFVWAIEWMINLVSLTFPSIRWR